jgi:amidase
MDYRGIGEGVVVFLPVFADGALLFLGDGHAIQGNGEITGSGVEVSMDITFAVYVIKGRTIQWPRGENEHEIFAIGNARPLTKQSSMQRRRCSDGCRRTFLLIP